MVSAGDWAPPDEVPTAPDLDLDYGELSRGESTVLGSGGSAVVSRTSVERDGHRIPLALKEPQQDDETVAITEFDRFRDEAEDWERIDDHDHIVGVVDWDIEPVPWIAMEYSDGGSLADRLENRDGPTPPAQAAWVGLCVSRGTRYAHRFSIVHRDIKPANVLFHETDGWPVAKVGDWGLARSLRDDESTASGFTPRYAAPEQLDEDFGPTGPETDVYQVGTLVYELLTGEHPFTDAPTVTQGVLSAARPEPPSDRVDVDVPDPVDAAVVNALARDPDERDDSVVYLRDTLEDWLEALLADGEPSSADDESDAASTTDESPPTSVADDEADQSTSATADATTGSSTDAETAESDGSDRTSRATGETTGSPAEPSGSAAGRPGPGDRAPTTGGSSGSTGNGLGRSSGGSSWSRIVETGSGDFSGLFFRNTPFWAAISALTMPIGASFLINELTAVSLYSAGGSSDLSAVGAVFVLVVLASMLMFPYNLYADGSGYLYPVVLTLLAYLVVPLVAGSSTVAVMALLSVYGGLAVLSLLTRYLL